MKLLSFEKQKKLLAEYRIPLCPSFLAESESRALKGAELLGWPLVLKVSSPDILHKTEIGGLEKGIKNREQLKKSFRRITASVEKNRPEAEIEGLLVQKQIEGTELIFGMKRDPSFGPVLMAGLGGIFVEVLKDVSLRIAPVKEKEALQMLKELKAWPLIKGFRGRPALNAKLLARILVSLSALSLEKEEIREIDFNPLIAFESKVLVADSKILI